ncbi:P-loop containing nucleoside triphosphate hydrolase protein [Multifurca ochricompacta]|uniref:ATP-dependent RNA helicase n=1 Tax=Multifurca ochricompacta TaxID=376703 RepID=A0AAD4LXA4_9AGAM|nr:P-loop containing nucleoside triphosphate hydrolase protein [Multifurca ochricompacta]
MDDNLVLNLALEEGPSVIRRGSIKKGGRWTDRLKSKRIEKRKSRNPSRSHTAIDVAHPKPRQPAQIISSLFSSNPKLEQKPTPSVPKAPSKPSNAPLTDSSTFTGLGLNPLITTHITTKMNILKPTSIQRASLLALLSRDGSSSSSLRDAFIQSQTGSGKTLSYLLPILHDLLPLSANSYIDRSIGTLAIIIAPTRELAKQISDVLDVLLKLRLRPLDAAPDDEEKNDSRLTRWLVSGLLTGGATRAHEKARIRKGIPILVATPGRLLDHLQNTSSLDTSKCRWLVLDEADRLMDLGFADAIKGILACLDGSRKLALQAVKDGRTMERRTILCSATMREDVQVLAGTALHDPIIIKATELDLPKQETTGTTEDATASATDPKFTPPSQLSQKYIIVPLKLRLVTLVALLRSLLSQSGGRRGFKIIVFLSCTDSRTDSDDETTAATVAAARTTGKVGRIEVHSPLLPDTSIFRLHGSLALSTRLASLHAFSATNKTSESSDRLASVLLCTSVAARGLDLPRVRAVVQYDLPTEGGATEYVHPWAIIAPSEEKWVEWVQARMASGTMTTTEESSAGAGHQFEAVAVEEILQKGFGGQGREYEERATEVQLAFERWCLHRKQNVEMARKAFASHLRAYATHPSDEKHIFHIRHLHLGHLAKSFALREAPSTVSGAWAREREGRHGGAKKKKRKALGPKESRDDDKNDDDNDGEDGDKLDAERRMRAVVRSQGRLVKKGGLWRAQAHRNSKSRLAMHWRGWLTGLEVFLEVFDHEHG